MKEDQTPRKELYRYNYAGKLIQEPTMEKPLSFNYRSRHMATNDVLFKNSQDWTKYNDHISSLKSYDTLYTEWPDRDLALGKDFKLQHQYRNKRPGWIDIDEGGYLVTDENKRRIIAIPIVQTDEQVEEEIDTKAVIEEFLKDWEVGKIWDLSGWTPAERKEFIMGFLQIAGSQMAKMFVAFGLKTHIEGSLYNEGTDEWFKLTFNKVSKQEAVLDDLTPSNQSEDKPLPVEGEDNLFTEGKQWLFDFKKSFC